MSRFLDFEKPVAELDSKIAELQHISHSGDMNIADEISRLNKKSERLLTQLYAGLSPWQKVQVARHADRPQFLDYLNAFVEDFVPLAGDRKFAEDEAIIGGMGRIDGRSVMVIGQQKGNDTESRIRHNFGMAKPEGYRKAQRLMELADHYRLPIVTFVDTAGAYPGLEAEERGQAEAIARCTETCLNLKVPLVSIIIGEGGSGGAIAIATGNAVLMLEHSVYSVISPEGCASILWRSATKAADAANALKLTAQDLMKLGVIEKIIPEPLGGAHRNINAAMQSVRDAISTSLASFSGHNGQDIRNHRREKFMTIGNKGL